MKISLAELPLLVGQTQGVSSRQTAPAQHVEASCPFTKGVPSSNQPTSAMRGPQEPLEMAASLSKSSQESPAETK